MNALEHAALRESRPALARHVAPLRRAAVAFAADAGADEVLLEDVALAMSEALSNSVVHAYQGTAAPGSVTVAARRDDTALVISVCDDGCGMVPRSDSPGLGLGLALIARVTERFQIEEREPGVRLTMTFSLNGRTVH